MNLNKQEHIESLLKDAKQIIESLDQSSQDKITRTIEQYQLRWNTLREHLNKSLQDTGEYISSYHQVQKFIFYFLEKIRTQTQNLIQDCDVHLKKCVHFISTLTEIQNDATQISQDKLENLKVKHFFLSFILYFHRPFFLFID